MLPYTLADFLEMVVDIGVAETHECDTGGKKIGCSDIVVHCVAGLIMLRAIQLDNQTRFVAKEISNVVANNFLTAESGFAKTQTVVPQVTLFFRHILTQRLCQGQQFIVAR